MTETERFHESAARVIAPPRKRAEFATKGEQLSSPGFFAGFGQRAPRFFREDEHLIRLLISNNSRKSNLHSVGLLLRAAVETLVPCADTIGKRVEEDDLAPKRAMVLVA